MKTRRGGVPKEVFLSHASRDRAIADRIAAELRAHTVPVWYSRTNLAGAQQWHDEIGDALSRCDWFLLLLSPYAVKSEWVKRELVYALNDSRYTKRIVPCLLRPCDVSALSWTLPSVQRVDFTSGFDGGMEQMLRVWGLGYAPAEEAPTLKARTRLKKRR